MVKHGVNMDVHRSDLTVDDFLLCFNDVCVTARINKRCRRTA